MNNIKEELAKLTLFYLWKSKFNNWINNGNTNSIKSHQEDFLYTHEKVGSKAISNELKKTLGLSAALSTVVGMVIGSGVFFKPQAIYTATNGAPGLGIIAWIVGGIITITAGLTAAELSAAIPKTGGMMTYIEEIYGERLGFLTGWMQTVLFFPGTAAALAVIFA